MVHIPVLEKLNICGGGGVLPKVNKKSPFLFSSCFMLFVTFCRGGGGLPIINKRPLGLTALLSNCLCYTNDV